MTIDRTDGRKGNGGARILAMRAFALIAAVIVYGTGMMLGASTAAASQPKAPRRQSERIPPRWKPPVGLMAHVDRGLDPADPDIQWSDHDPRGMILRGPARWDPRVDVPMGLIAYLDRGVDPASSNATDTREVALEDARDFQWTVVGPKDHSNAGRVERSDTGEGIPRWAFTATEPGDYVISVRWGPFESDSIGVKVKLGEWQPIGVVVKKSMLGPSFARVHEDYVLDAWLEYENVDSQFVDQKTRGGERRYITVKARKKGQLDEILGSVRGWFNRWVFKVDVDEPGTYEVWAEYDPPEPGLHLDSRDNGKLPIEIRVVHEFAGKYKGNVRTAPNPKARAAPRLSSFEFTVDDYGHVEDGRFHFGDGVKDCSGTFRGNVEVTHGWPLGPNLFGTEGVMDCEGTYVEVEESELTPEMKRAIAQLLGQGKKAAGEAGGSSGYEGDAQVQELSRRALEAIAQAEKALGDMGTGGPNSGEVDLRLTFRYRVSMEAAGSMNTKYPDRLRGEVRANAWRDIAP